VAVKRLNRNGRHGDQIASIDLIHRSYVLLFVPAERPRTQN
jgi:hypothetical protein